MNSLILRFLMLVYCVIASVACAAEFKFETQPLAWQQVEGKLTFHFFIEREIYTSLDRSVRIVFAAESERSGQKLDALSVRWTISENGRLVASGRSTIEKGGVDVTFPLAQLPFGRYDVKAELLKGDLSIAEKTALLRYEKVEAPASSGKVPLQLPRGMPLAGQTWPVYAGVPFPKGVLWDPRNVRVLDANGREVDADVTVRSRWGYGESASIRWLGVQFQPGKTEPSWPDGGSSYKIDFGPQISRATPKLAIKVAEDAKGITVETGATTLRINRNGYNVINRWSPGTSGKGQVLQSTPQHGLYVVDNEGTVYRAANDTAVDLRVEEKSAMHVVIRASGWYVKDGAANPPVKNLVLPTDKLCRFVTRIEAYAGKPYARVTNTLILTFDTFKVRLRDAGMSLPFPAGDTAMQATFGVEGSGPVKVPMAPGGVRGVQHLHNSFTVEDGTGKSLAESLHSDGWIVAQGHTSSLMLSLRDTWQRYPKEFEVLPDAVKLHVWPAHGREHPQINPIARNQIHRLLFSHQGTELNLAMPWDYYFSVCNSYNSDSAGGVNHTLAAVQASGMGVATTSDVLIQFGQAGDETKLIEDAVCFQLAPDAVADPKWNCDSLALGYINPYDPKTFPSVEQIIQDCMRGYWKYQDMGEMFGMWIYRSWLHSAYNGNGEWELYRLYNGSHHYEAMIPWMLYARSGDPFYLTQGMANIRQFTDVQMIHHADPRSTHKEDSQQKQLIGSTKHDNCVVPWGRDHSIMGHITCYNAPITAYYLTGDLRLREVVVDEWLNTLLADRLNPEYAAADLSNKVFPSNPRDNSMAISEVLDAYQLTYDPRLLVYLAPRYEIWTEAPGCMGADWGQPLHNEVLFRGSTAVREKLMAGIEAERAGKPALDKPFVRSIHATQEMFSVAGILDPQGPCSAEAFSCFNYGYLKGYSWNRISGKTNNVFCNTGEFVAYLPRVMYAVAHCSRQDLAPILGAAQPAPRNTEKPTRVVVRKDVDQDFKVYINGIVTAVNGFDIQAFDPDGKLVARQRVASGQQNVEMVVPRDGKTGQYVLFVGALQNDNVFVPFTTLPEVYCHTFWTACNDPQRFFTRSPSEQPMKLTITPARAPSTILARNQVTELANTETGERMEVDVGSEGVWVWNRACYIGGFRDGDDKKPVILSISPERWFMPEDKSMAVQPTP